MIWLFFFLSTAHFCSDEMLKEANKKNKKEVDLYYNDLVCLENSITNISQSK